MKLFAFATGKGGNRFWGRKRFWFFERDEMITCSLFSEEMILSRFSMLFVYYDFDVWINTRSPFSLPKVDYRV